MNLNPTMKTVTITLNMAKTQFVQAILCLHDLDVGYRPSVNH